MQQLINYLIQGEHISAYLYLAMSNYFLRLNLPGMANWLRIQHTEELNHALILMNYLTDRCGVAEILPIPTQPINFGTPAQAFEAVLEHEEVVTEGYRRAYALAVQANDYQTMVLFQDFLREQTAEVAQALLVAGRLCNAGNNSAAILLLDQELGQRAPVSPAALGALTPSPGGALGGILGSALGGALGGAAGGG